MQANRLVSLERRLLDEDEGLRDALRDVLSRRLTQMAVERGGHQA